MPAVPAPTRFTDDVLASIAERLRLLDRRRILDERPQASVLVPLCHVDGAGSVLVTKRSTDRGPHTVRSGLILPQFTAGPATVWGLTAYLLDEVLRDALGLDLAPIAAPGSH